MWDFIRKFKVNYLVLRDFMQARRVFKYAFPKNLRLRSDQMLLIEAYQVPTNRLGLSIFTPVAAMHFGAVPIAYTMGEKSKISFLKNHFRFKFSIEKLFGCSKIWNISASLSSQEYSLLATQLINRVTDKSAFEALTYKEIHVGDLIYDFYLRHYGKVTLDLQDSKLIECLALNLQYFDQFYYKFKEGKVSAVCVSHTVYNQGIPARIAASFGVAAYQVTGEHIYLIDSTNTHAYTGFKYYPDLYKSLPWDIQSIGTQIAENRLKLRFSGEVGVDMHYSNASAYTSHRTREKLLDRNNKIKILIAPHDFYDSPHSYGNNFYPDFYEWLVALSRIAQQKDYSWYIKTHPDVQADLPMILNEFAKQNSKFKILPSDTSHHQIIEEGINLCLTVFGTIAVEYSYLGVPVINASLNNPHVKYDFCITPEDVEEYESTLLNLNLNFLSLTNNKDSILEYYFIHNIYNLNSWLFSDYEAYIRDIGGILNCHSWRSFDYFANNENAYQINIIRSAIEEFLQQRSQYLSRKHFAPFYSDIMKFSVGD